MMPLGSQFVGASKLALVGQLDACLTDDQEDAGLTPAGLATFFRGD